MGSLASHPSSLCHTHACSAPLMSCVHILCGLAHLTCMQRELFKSPEPWARRSSQHLCPSAMRRRTAPGTSSRVPLRCCGDCVSLTVPTPGNTCTSTTSMHPCCQPAWLSSCSWSCPLALPAAICNAWGWSALQGARAARNLLLLRGLPYWPRCMEFLRCAALYVVFT